MDIKKIEHHGIVAGIIDDLGIVKLVDQYLPQDKEQKITPGQAIKGMIINGLGFSNRPLSLTPQFFKSLPVEHLFDENTKAEYFNRHKLGRTLEQCYDFDCETLFSLIAAQACKIENVDTRFQSLDSTSFSLTGEYNAETDENTVNITHGYSKDHRPDLKQIVQELIVSQDGGVPLLSKVWDGNTSDNKIFRERSKHLVESFKTAGNSYFCVADSKLYHQKNADYLAQINFITRVPSSIKEVKQKVDECLKDGSLKDFIEGYKFCKFDVQHMGIQQRWLVFESLAARKRATKTLEKQILKAEKALEKSLFHLQAQRFGCRNDADKALKNIVKKLKFHQIEAVKYTEYAKYTQKGKPKKGSQADKIEWQINAGFIADKEAFEFALRQKSAFVLASNASVADLSDEDIFYKYKAQSCVEGGFRFLKEPSFFVSSLFLKKPSRIDALVMVMSLSLLVYSIAQRRLRKRLKADNKTVPNQINQAIQNPTMRWIFQCFDGIFWVNMALESSEKTQVTPITIQGMTDLRQFIIELIGGKCVEYYNIQENVQRT